MNGGKFMNGILPLWKPKGMTSHDCVAKLRKIYGTKKVGHTGTLDPEVEGVLVICIGQATKVVPYLTAMDKTYIAECSLGVATETEDSYGKIVAELSIEALPTTEEIEKTLQTFKGEITQIPPMYSAVKVNGKKLYEYARANQYVERPSRQVYIHKLQRVDQDIEQTNTFKLEVVCSAGTYIRTLCVDIGKQLGYPAHMSHLVRTEACSYTAEDTLTFEEIIQAKESGQIEDTLHSISGSLKHLDVIQVNEEIKTKILHGQKLIKPEQKLATEPFLMMYDEQLLALYETHPENPKQIKPVRVFHM